MAKFPKNGKFQGIFFFAFFASFSLQRIFFAKIFFVCKESLFVIHYNKYVSILDQDVSQFKPYSLLLNSNDIRGRFVNLNNLDTLAGNLDFLIVEKDKGLEFSEILEIMNRRKIQKSLLVINEDEVQEFKVNVLLI